MSTDSKFAGIPVKITNKLTVPVEIYDVFNPAATGQTEPYQYTKLGTIAAGATGTVKTIREVSQLEAMYTGTIPELQSWYYHQFPVKLMSGTQFLFGNPPPLSYTIEDSDRQSMIQSFLFHKFAMANPDSALTKNLNAALKSGDPQAVNAFFAGTKNFKNCTLSSWNAVMTWLTMFTSGWQGPYYLYQAAPSNPPQGYSPALAGTLNIVSTASADSATFTMCSQDASGKLQPASPAQTSTVVMAGDGTMVDQNPGEDVSLTLTPVWMNVVQSTVSGNQPQTSYIPGPTVTGTVAGMNVVSSQTLIPLPSQAQSGSGDDSSATFTQIFSTICEVIGLIVGLVMIYELVANKVRGKDEELEEDKSTAKSEPEYDERVNAVDEASSKATAEVVNENADKVASSAQKVADSYTKVTEIQQKGVLTEALNGQATELQEKIQTEISDGVTPTPAFEAAVEKAGNSLATAQKQVDDGDLQGAIETSTDTVRQMNQTLNESSGELAQQESQALQDASKTVNTAVEQVNDMSEATENINKEQANPASDSGYGPEDTGQPDVDPIGG